MKDYSEILVGIGLLVFFAIWAIVGVVSVSAQHLPPMSQTATPTPVSASSGNVANATATATIAAVVDRTNYLCGVVFGPGFATAGASVAATITGLTGGTLTMTANAGPSFAPPVTVPFTTCLRASAANTAITASMPALGAGNTNASVSAWGYQL